MWSVIYSYCQRLEYKTKNGFIRFPSVDPVNITLVTQDFKNRSFQKMKPANTAQSPVNMIHTPPWQRAKWWKLPATRCVCLLLRHGKAMRHVQTDKMASECFTTPRFLVSWEFALNDCKNVCSNALRTFIRSQEASDKKLLWPMGFALCMLLRVFISKKLWEINAFFA